MDSITAKLTIRDSLRDNLTDPYTLFSSPLSARDGEYWIFADEPHGGAKYPKIDIAKAMPTTTNVISSSGSSYASRERDYFNVWFYSKAGAHIVVNGKTYTNTQLVEYYLGLIKSTIKSQFSTITTNGGIKSIIPTADAPPEFQPDTQLYVGYVTFRVEYFDIGDC